jgi:hypothetical protein
MTKMRGTDDGGIFVPTEGRSGTVGQKKTGENTDGVGFGLRIQTKKMNKRYYL